MSHELTDILILYILICFTQLPVLGVNLQTFPILGIIGGFLYSTYNYFYIILNGGVGKNGSTVAVSALQQCLGHYSLCCFCSLKASNPIAVMFFLALCFI